MSLRIFLDMDGVIADLLTPVLKKYNIQWKDYPRGVWDIEKALNIPFHSVSSIWTDDFFENLKPTDDAFEIVAECMSVGETCILSKPYKDRGFIGKYRWLEKYFPYFIKHGKYLFGPPKDFCAGPETVLVDDNDLHIETFRSRGGHGILVPRIWNSGHSYCQNAIPCLRLNLRRFQ